MIKRLLTAAGVALALSASAQNINPTVASDFDKRVKEVNNPAYFEVFTRNLSPEQRDALQSLYAYMPLPDIADNSGDYFLENVDYSLRARKEMPWGSIVPDREFRHFVLPVRINDEALDHHRSVFYEELKDRVKGLSMKDAILEVNHWCHEKATYQPSDGRTHAPLATVYTAIGRCGEESTFTVAALRAVGIPARQVYTPRWAHTDDNHAWVEAWADGKWYFLGACEPEAVLNLGWFNAPASRGMLMNTRVFGRYDGPEEVLLRLKGYTDINVTPNYAPIDTITVTVLDTQGNPVPDATIDFRLYNYAELYPIVTAHTDVNGTATLTTGLGDIILWGSKDGRYGISKAAVGSDRTANVVLDRSAATNGVLEFDIVPPMPSNKPVVVPPDMAAENDRRKAYEDSLRGSYTSTFASPAQAAAIAAELGLDAERLTKVLTDARGNHAVVMEFLSSAPESDRQRALRLLEVISQKDRSDVPLAVLADHFTAPVVETDLYDEYILSPRIDNELLTLYRRYFTEAIPAEEMAAFRADPQKWVAWTADNINICPDWLPAKVRMSPVAVWEGRTTNAASRNIFFVAGARSMGIPARIDPVTGKTQWADGEGRWIDAIFDSSSDELPAGNPQGLLQLDFSKTGRIDNPKYYSQFSLAKIVDGRPQLLNYPEEATWQEILAEPAALDEGQYMLVTGQRMANGGVLSRLEFFTVAPDSLTRFPMILRQDEKGVQVIGNFDAETIYHDTASDSDKSIISTTGRGYYILGLITPNHEPSNHALRDIAVFNPDFEQWGQKMLILFKDEQEESRFDATQLPALPSTAVYGRDIDGNIARQISESLGLETSDRPIFIIADTFNRIVFVSQGYTIGLGEQLIDTIHQIGE